MNLVSYFRREWSEIVREIVISITIASLIATAFAYYSDKRIDNRIAARQFIYDFNRAFFDNPKYRNISIALEEQYLYNKKFLKKNGLAFTDYELDDYLYLISDIWLFYEEGFISKDLLDYQYSYFFCVTYNSQAINDYRKKLESQGFSNTHNVLDDINSEFGLEGENCRLLGLVGIDTILESEVSPLSF